jgi:hypothetical protein
MVSTQRRLALASDRIPGPDQNNIRSGLVTLFARLPGLSQSSGTMLPQGKEQMQVTGRRARYLVSGAYGVWLMANG